MTSFSPCSRIDHGKLWHFTSRPALLPRRQTSAAARNTANFLNPLHPATRRQHEPKRQENSRRMCTLNAEDWPLGGRPLSTHHTTPKHHQPAMRRHYAANGPATRVPRVSGAAPRRAALPPAAAPCRGSKCLRFRFKCVLTQIGIQARAAACIKQCSKQMVTAAPRPGSMPAAGIAAARCCNLQARCDLWAVLVRRRALKGHTSNSYEHSGFIFLSFLKKCDSRRSAANGTVASAPAGSMSRLIWRIISTASGGLEYRMAEAFIAPRPCSALMLPAITPNRFWSKEQFLSDRLQAKIKCTQALLGGGTA